MIRKLLQIFFILSAVILSSTVAGAESIAFGFFNNELKNESFDYLEKILPNSFASALKNKHGFDIVKPGKIDELLPDQYGFKKEIDEAELPELSSEIDADYLIYGSFRPLENNRIRLTVKVYRIDDNSIFVYEETGQLQTEFFRLVDKIALQLKNLTGDSMRFKSAVVAGKSKISIITNVEGDELNVLYYEFMTNGFGIFPSQGNELHSIIDDETINSFYHISGTNASYHIIHNRNDEDINLYYGTWSSNKHFRRMMEEKDSLKKFSFNYLKTKNEIISKIKAFNNGSAEYMLIIGFDDSRSEAWIRCINLNDNTLIISENGIKGSSINEVSREIIKSITTGLPEKK